MINIYFFGRPTGFELFSLNENSLVEATAYYQQFYTGGITTPWRFLIRQNKDVIRYIYIRHGLIGYDKRVDSFWGIALELRGVYLDCPSTQLVPFLHKYYESIVKNANVIDKDANGNFIFKTDSLKNEKNYLANEIKKLSTIPLKLKEHVIALDTNLENLTAQKIAQLTDRAGDEAIVAKLKEYGGVNILPYQEEEKTDDVGIVVELPDNEKNYWGAIQDEINKREALINKREEQIRQQYQELTNEKLRIAENEKKIREQQEVIKKLEVEINVNSNAIASNEAPISVVTEEKPLQAEKNNKIKILLLNGFKGIKKYRTEVAVFSLSIICAIGIYFIFFKPPPTSGGHGLVKKQVTSPDSAAQASTNPESQTDSPPILFPEYPNPPVNCSKWFQENKPTVTENKYSETIDRLNELLKKRPDCKDAINTEINKLKNQRIQYVFGLIKDYTNTFPYTETKTDEYNRMAKTAGCEKSERTLLASHQTDADTFKGGSTNENDYVTTAYKIAALLKQGLSNDDIKKKLNGITNIKINSVKTNFTIQ